MKNNTKQQTPRSPMRSPWPTHAHPLCILNDRRIEHYLRKGFYGRAAQEDALLREKEKERKKALSPMRRGSRASVNVARLDLTDLY